MFTALTNKQSLSLVMRRKYVIWRYALVCERLRCEQLTALLLRRKYLLWRCALVCERLRCEPCSQPCY